MSRDNGRIAWSSIAIETAWPCLCRQFNPAKPRGSRWPQCCRLACPCSRSPTQMPQPLLFFFGKTPPGTFDARRANRASTSLRFHGAYGSGASPYSSAASFRCMVDRTLAVDLPTRRFLISRRFSSCCNAACNSLERYRTHCT